MVYLTTVMKIDPAIAGIIVFVGRIFDAFCDPLMGWITDRTKTRWGRRRPYLMVGALVCGMSLPLVYSAHLFTAINPIVMAVFVLLVYSLGFTIFNVPYLAMPVEMTTNRMDRFSIMSYRVIFMMLGGLVGNAGAPLLIEKLGQGGSAYTTLGWVGGATVFVVMAITFFGTHSANSSEPSPTSDNRFNFREQIETIARNKPFCTMIIVKIAQFFAIAASASTIAFFVTVVLKQGFDLLSVFGIASTISIIVSIPFWRWVGKFMPKRRGFMIGLVGEIVSTLMMLLITPDNAYELFLTRGIMTGFFASAILLNSQAMWLDTIDYDYKLTGLRREGMYTSIYVFIERLGYSLGPLILGFLLGFMGFNKNLPLNQQPESAELAVYIGMIWIPIIMYIIGFVALMFYRLPEVIGDKEVT